MNKDFIVASPSAGATGLILLGIPLDHYIVIGTAVYTLFIVVTKGIELYQKIKELKRGARN